ELKLPYLHFGRVANVAVAILPRAGLKRSLDVEGAPLPSVLSKGLSLLSPCDNTVPLGLLDHLTFLVAVGRVRRDPKVGDRLSRTGVPEFGVLTQITDQDNLVYSSCHDPPLETVNAAPDCLYRHVPE